jgi:hypothetical protein
MSWILFCVSGEMFDCLRNARDTVITLTPARFAISARVTGFWGSTRAQG